MPEDAPEPARETVYDVDALRTAYGDVPVWEHTFDVEDASEHAAEAARGELGGARVVVVRERDGAVLYANVRDDPAAWDVPGGAREGGESLEATAVREVHEEVGLSVALDDAVFANRLTFDDGERAVTGVWAYFTAIVADPPALDVQREELAATTWRTARPVDVDDFLERALDAIEDREDAD